MLPKPWPLHHALRKVEELCAIHEANVTIALLFQMLIELKRKTGRPMHVRGRPVERRTGVRGKGGLRRFTETNAVRFAWFQEWKKRRGRLAPLPYRVGGGAPIARVSPGFIGLGSLTTSEPVVAGGAVAVPRSGISPGAVTVPRSRLPRILLPLVSVGDGVVGLTRGAVVGLTRGTD